MLLGVSIGPNLTYTGSLATLLWRRIAHHHGSAPDLTVFTRLRVLTVPAPPALAVLAPWAGLHLRGGWPAVTEAGIQVRSVVIRVREGTR